MIYFLFYFCSHLIGALPQKTWSEKLKRFELIFHSLISNTQSFKSEYLKSPIVPLAIGVTFQTGRSVAEKKTKNISKIDTIRDPVGSTVRYEMMKLCTGSV